MGISQYPPSSAHNHDDRYYTKSETDTEIDNATPSPGAASLTNDTVSANGSLEQWGTETVNLGDPGAAVSVLAWVSGYAVNTTSTSLVRAQVQISLDGGSTWVDGNTPVANVDGTGSIERVIQYSQAHTSGTPSGDVIVRARIQQNSGTAGDVQWVDGLITAVMHR